MSKNVLVSGAGFAGLTTAYWLNRNGYRVTLVEVAEGLKKGGTPVDIVGKTVDIVKRMNLFDEVRAHALPPRSTVFKRVDDTVEARMEADPLDDDGDQGRYEVPRDDLLRILFDTIKDDVEVIFGDSITTLTDVPGGVRATFRVGPDRDFAMVFGCDGNHSLVRKLRFGSESEFSHFLGAYFAISIVDKGVIEPNTTEINSVPGRTVMLNSYENKTDICFLFRSETEISYHYRNQDEQRQILIDRFKDHGWRSAALLEDLASADNFYFDKLCQVRMPRWSDGRTALVGDAAYCASPAAGMGGSLAIIGATALGDALEQHGTDIDAAFKEYDRSLRPFVEDVQADVVSFGLATFFPATEDEIQKRNEFLLR
ncbi:FAD-dependent oxidoreductase [Paractinoplanes abujensis]|uniref:2-polyprenyl-6-methoxyphenol hydroxylase-like FAD-dependent oxidoreductase n=1 Tax=Paractinoplanes abujensis TaxID=882441 RepID=A0A7W7G2K6_9ACTN|nr:FAD-dependent monooxygenase [Actinoplanes abujensis]MBB4691751.1 2-polyprenyl-6-methoxyphenol hydroxylase-like FAD-dependent oxidoreductase [Actinoplanes abujensis]GID16827.1 FAD-dependent oxidoreductase [Actinoplanes abujensis]